MVVDAVADLAALEESIRDGAEVTAAQLSKARDMAALAELRREADERAERRGELERVDAERAAFRREHLEVLGGEWCAAQEAYSVFVAALAGLQSALGDYRQHLAAARKDAGRLGISAEMGVFERSPRFALVLEWAQKELRNPQWSGNPALWTEEHRARFTAKRDALNAAAEQRAEVSRRELIAKQRHNPNSPYYEPDLAAEPSTRNELHSW